MSIHVGVRVSAENSKEHRPIANGATLLSRDSKGVVVEMVEMSSGAKAALGRDVGRLSLRQEDHCSHSCNQPRP